MTRGEKRLSLLFVVVLGTLLVGCGATPIEVVDPSLVGAWHGECEIDLPVVFDPSQLPEGVERTRTAVPLDITIHEDATVAGSFGEAILEECVLKYNRGELGRSLNIASDYVITDGYLSGPIVPGEDETDVKSFTIPFDLVDSHIQGGLMWVQEGTYPFPLCVGVDLERTP